MWAWRSACWLSTQGLLIVTLTDNTPLTASVHTTDTTECNGMRPETCSPTLLRLLRY